MELRVVPALEGLLPKSVVLVRVYLEISVALENQQRNIQLFHRLHGVHLLQRPPVFHGKPQQQIVVGEIQGVQLAKLLHLLLYLFHLVLNLVVLFFGYGIPGCLCGGQVLVVADFPQGPQAAGQRNSTGQLSVFQGNSRHQHAALAVSQQEACVKSLILLYQGQRRQGIIGDLLLYRDVRSHLLAFFGIGVKPFVVPQGGNSLLGQSPGDVPERLVGVDGFVPVTLAGALNQNHHRNLSLRILRQSEHTGNGEFFICCEADFLLHYSFGRRLHRGGCIGIGHP